MNQQNYAQLHVWSFGFALGLLWGLWVLATGLTALFFGLGVGFVETMRTVYLGYEASIPGSFIGGIWGFVDMFVLGSALAAFYNFLIRRKKS